MATARQCDRCGKFYRVYYDNPVRPKFKVEGIDNDSIFRGNINYDLCQACQDELDDMLEKFLNNEERYL